MSLHTNVATTTGKVGTGGNGGLHSVALSQARDYFYNLRKRNPSWGAASLRHMFKHMYM